MADNPRTVRFTSGKLEGTEVEVTLNEVVRQLDVRWNHGTRILLRLEVGGREGEPPLIVLAPGEGLRIKAVDPTPLERAIARSSLDVVVQEDDGEP